MKHFCLISLLLFVLYSCRDKDSPNKTNKTKDNPSIIHDNFSKTRLRVSAYLIYNDGTLSSFDVLNDKTIALWNVIAGGGDTIKPSENTKIIFDGDFDSTNIKIKNGQKFVVDTMIIHSDKNIDFIIKNTGCQEMCVSILKEKTTIYNDTIPFHCGE